MVAFMMKTHWAITGALTLSFVGCGGDSTPSHEEAIEGLALESMVELDLPIVDSPPECTPCVVAKSGFAPGAEIPPESQPGFGNRLILEYLVPNGYLLPLEVLNEESWTRTLYGGGEAPTILGGDPSSEESQLFWWSRRFVRIKLARRANPEISSIEPLEEDWWRQSGEPESSGSQNLWDQLWEAQVAVSEREVRVTFQYRLEPLLPGMSGKEGRVHGSAVLGLSGGKWIGMGEHIRGPNPPWAAEHEIEELRIVMSWLSETGRP
jgi:hypothetical protein